MLGTPARDKVNRKINRTQPTPNVPLNQRRTITKRLHMTQCAHHEMGTPHEPQPGRTPTRRTPTSEHIQADSLNQPEGPGTCTRKHQTPGHVIFHESVQPTFTFNTNPAMPDTLIRAGHANKSRARDGRTPNVDGHIRAGLIHRAGIPNTRHQLGPGYLPQHEHKARTRNDRAH